MWKYTSTHFQIYAQKLECNWKKDYHTGQAPSCEYLYVYYIRKQLHILTILYNNLTSMSMAFAQMCGHPI